jgi:hypothetical protein
MERLRRLRDWRVWFVAICVIAFSGEAYWVFGHTVGTFRIEGLERYEMDAFAGGARVAHSFMMSGDGLSAVRVHVNSRVAANARIGWTLFRGSPDVVPMTAAEVHEDQVALRPGPQWLTFNVIRDGSSNDDWYTFELRLVDVVPVSGPAIDGPLVTITASRDNPERGGILWVDDARQPGSLLIRADRNGRTLYRRFMLEAAPHMPRMFRTEAVQWLLALALHGALVVFAYAVLREASQLTETASGNER